MTRSEVNGEEFKEIFLGQGSRNPMSKPPRAVASSKLIREVADLLGVAVDDAKARDVSDWFADKLNRFGMLTARPVFGMDGQGPQCSSCSMIWPLCGCYHHSAEFDDEDTDEEGDETDE
ncbi:hypothetical protein [Microbacterium sp. G2-8]|uniref:hypothetical protein n=1 Tax=Microbacterium sp. G2-8 TaxID=2842454 RepID=UPI001C891D41|nr:hypothetical protein [Microbacterium sp. G2-8]